MFLIIKHYICEIKIIIMELFHGGCHGCTMQAKEGLGYCVGCTFFEMDFNLSDLNDQHERNKQRMKELREKAKELAKIKNLKK